MTILPNKKQPKEKNEGESKEHYNSHHNHGNSTDGRIARRSSPPPQWNSVAPRENIRASTHDHGAGVEEYSNHDITATKKRHRLSPHRSSRKQRNSVEKDRGNSSKSANIACFSVSSPPYSGNATRHAPYRTPPPAIASSSSSSHEELDDGMDDPEGCNSGDEYGPREFPEDQDELEFRFERALKEKRGFIIKKMRQDGACLFRAVADQVFGDEEQNVIVRRDCIEYMAKNADFFKQYVTEDFNEYLKRKRKHNAHGNYVEMQAICEMYNRPIEIYQYSLDPINIFHCVYETDNEPIRLSYHRNIHYNSVVDPYKATIGVGLGLPGLQPGLADKTLMSDALKMSEDQDLEKTMLDDKMKETDWEVTQEAIDEQVARESYLQWLRDQDKQNKNTTSSPPSASAACCSASMSKAGSGSPEIRNSKSPGHSGVTVVVAAEHSSPTIVNPATHSAASLDSESAHVHEASSSKPTGEQLIGAQALPEFSLQMFGLTDWDEDDILAEVIRRSQAEYLDSLKKGSSSGCSSKSSSNDATSADNKSSSRLDSKDSSL